MKKEPQVSEDFLFMYFICFEIVPKIYPSLFQYMLYSEVLLQVFEFSPLTVMYNFFSLLQFN